MQYETTRATGTRTEHRLNDSPEATTANEGRDDGGCNFGPAAALARADPDADPAEVLKRVPRYECQGCGSQKFGRSARCGECGHEEIEQVPGPAAMEGGS